VSNLTPLLPTSISSFCPHYCVQAAYTKGETKISLPAPSHLDNGIQYDGSFRVMDEQLKW